MTSRSRYPSGWYLRVASRTRYTSVCICHAGRIVYPILMPLELDEDDFLIWAESHGFKKDGDWYRSGLDYYIDLTPIREDSHAKD